MAHFAAAAVLFRDVLVQLSPRLVSPLQRIIFEVMLYNLAFHSMFCPMPEAAFSALDWLLCQYGLTRHEKIGRPAYSHSPHLSGNFEFYSLMLRITRLSRQHYGPEHRAQHVSAWLLELDRLDQRLRHYYAGAPQRIGDQLKAKHQLYSLALRIYSSKVKDHELPPSSPEVTNLVDQAKKMYKQGLLQGLHAAVVSWPLLVILCACANYATFDFFAKQIEKLETTFDRGHLARLQAVVVKLRHKHKEHADCAEHIDQDNFRSLVHKQGLIVRHL